MDSSLSNFELSESTVKIGTDSENGSDKSEPIEILGYGDVESNSSNKSDDDFYSNLPETVTLLTYEKTGAKVYLVGTAHFSKESQDDVAKVITSVLPNVVVLELCSSRTNILSLDEASVLEEAKNIDMQKIISTVRTNGLYNGLMYILLLNMSAHLTKQIGMAPGGGIQGDRPINITLKRALARLTWCQTIKLAWHLLTSKDPISVEDIEKCKNRGYVGTLASIQHFREVFLDERDIYLTNSLQVAAESDIRPKVQEGNADSSEPLKVVGVVGIGHVPGITRLWPHDQKTYLKDIVTVPPPSLTSKFIRYSYKVSLLAFGGYLIYRYVPVPKIVKEHVHVFVQK
ncbi:hypothetical protein NQ317_016483 [Molorchus minor]|uniref:TraB domain-containing protein n=1 Tax=Molorchus minor TaxID=1323400 RepID=A0ABQ9JH17_9CUCU|nr:hypothetical protein NQ317_016483 [Molorchus minor]